MNFSFVSRLRGVLSQHFFLDGALRAPSTLVLFSHSAYAVTITKFFPLNRRPAGAFYSKLFLSFHLRNPNSNIIIYGALRAPLMMCLLMSRFFHLKCLKSYTLIKLQSWNSTPSGCLTSCLIQLCMLDSLLLRTECHSNIIHTRRPAGPSREFDMYLSQPLCAAQARYICLTSACRLRGSFIKYLLIKFSHLLLCKLISFVRTRLYLGLIHS